jgi:four helix bundle protein
VTQGVPAGRGPGAEGRGYQQLRAWQSSHELALAAFRLSQSLRAGHRWLADQLVRSAVSVPANIAEGYNRGSLRQFLHFLTIARGSLAEVEYYVLFVGDAKLSAPEKLEELGVLVNDTGSLLLGLIRSLQVKEGSGRFGAVREDSAPYGPRGDSELCTTPGPHPATLVQEEL